ncbi:MAG: replication protein [Archaeoglobaceae archaeon]
MRRPFHFEGFSLPRYTQVPDEVFDVLMPHLGEADLKVLLYIVRRTFGFKKESDAISFNQFLKGIRKSDGTYLDYGCGIKHRTTLSKALKRLERMGVIVSRKIVDEKGVRQATVYSLRFKEHSVISEKGRGSARSELGDEDSSAQDAPILVRQPYRQKTEKQQTEKTTTSQTKVVDPPENQSKSLLKQMKAMGVSGKVACRLLKEYPHDWLQKLIDFTLGKLEKGWKPKESVAAWFVAAVQDKDFHLPENFKTRKEREEEKRKLEERKRKMEEEERKAWEEAKKREEIIAKVKTMMSKEELEALRKRAEKEILSRYKILSTLFKQGKVRKIFEKMREWKEGEIIAKEIVPKYFPEEGKSNTIG